MTRTPFADVNDLGAAEAQSAAARAQLGDTLDGIKQRLAPASLLDEAIDGVKTRSADLAETASNAVRDYPGTTAAGAAGFALLVARRPVTRLLRRLFSRK
jgi:ElaB/YqjD/DUF883 family membrane-anchored ribosome-binding protein